MKFRNPAPLTTLMSALCLACAWAAPAAAQVTPFVDHYATNLAVNTSAANNAVIQLLGNFNDVWTTGTAWNNGAPTALGAPVLRANMVYTRDVTLARTAAQELSAYITDRQNQSFSAGNGLGDLTATYRTGSGSFTTVFNFGDSESGNGAGSSTSALGKVVQLAGTLRGGFSSTNPPKAAFNFPRPYRMNLDSQVIVLGAEPGGFPIYDSPVVVAPSLLFRRAIDPTTDGGFPSGHTNAGYLASYALAYAVPERMASLMLNASAMGQDRIVAGMHSPVDVIGGRIQATALAAAILHDPANAVLKAEARAQAQGYFAAQLGAASPVSQAEWAAGKALFTERMTYGLPTVGSTGEPALVPKGAEVLLETRFTYLDAAQRREVLRTTAIESGHVGADDEGFSRLNLYAASGGYGRFDSDVVVTFSGGLDHWRNDISGTGGLTKAGDGTLVLTGANSYTGATQVAGGRLVVEGELASAVTVGNGATLGGAGLFKGEVSLGAGAMLDPGNSVGTSTFAGGLQLGDGASLSFELGTASDLVVVSGGLLSGSTGMGGVSLNFSAATGFGKGTYTLIDFSGASGTSSFDLGDFTIASASPGYGYSLALSGDKLQVTAVPEPATWALWLSGLAFAAGVARRRKQQA